MSSCATSACTRTSGAFGHLAGASCAARSMNTVAAWKRTVTAAKAASMVIVPLLMRHRAAFVARRAVVPPPESACRTFWDCSPNKCHLCINLTCCCRRPTSGRPSAAAPPAAVATRRLPSAVYHHSYRGCAVSQPEVMFDSTLHCCEIVTVLL